MLISCYVLKKSKFPKSDVFVKAKKPHYSNKFE